jgi:hypothetical protein
MLPALCLSIGKADHKLRLRAKLSLQIEDFLVPLVRTVGAPPTCRRSDKGQSCLGGKADWETIVSQKDEARYVLRDPNGLCHNPVVAVSQVEPVGT